MYYFIYLYLYIYIYKTYNTHTFQSIFIEVDELKCFILYEKKAHSYHVQNRTFFPTSDSDRLNDFFPPA